MAYYSWYDYYFYNNWNYLFKESNYNENSVTSIIGKYFYEVGGIDAMILFPLVIVFIIALFKEQIWDRLMKKGTYELNDIIATMIGWLVSTILNIIWII